MLITFIDMRGVVHIEVIPQVQTINQNVYKKILRRLFLSVREKRLETWQNNSWLLHHEDALAHNDMRIRQFLAKKNIAVSQQPSHSPDLTQCGCFLFPKLKGFIKETRFPDVEAIKRTVTTELRSICEESFHKCKEAWRSRIRKFVRHEGDDFKGENLKFV